MENYYEEIVQEIEDLLKNGKYEDARYLLKKELSMPYIPEEVEKKLKQLQKECTYSISEKAEEKEESLGSLLRRLKGKPQSQLSAVDGLCRKNLRECIPELQDWLSKDPQPEAAALLIEALGVQEIDEEFTYVKNGVEYTFSGADITPVSRSEGFLCAQNYLGKWFLHYPDYYSMANTLLIHEVYTFLPLSYDKEEGYSLAKMVASEVLDLMHEEDLKKKLGLETKQKS